MAQLLKFYRGAQAPANPVKGMIWFDTTEDVIKVYSEAADTVDGWESYGTAPADLKAVADRVATLEGKVKTLEETTIPALEQAIADALAEAKAKVADVTVGGTSVVNANKVAVLGTAAGKNEEYFVKSEGYVAYTQAEKDKLAAIEAGAEVNIIEEVQVNGVALEVSTDGKRAVNVVIPDATVKSVKEGDKVLKLEGTELSTELSLVYETQGEGDAAKKYIVLKGLNGVEIAKIDASDFIADSFLNDVELDADDNLQFTWAMADGSTKTDTVNIAKYIDTYKKGNGIDITDKTISVEVDAASEAFLTVGAGGVKLSGVQTAIDTAKGEAIAAIAPAIAALDADVTSAATYTVTDEEGTESTVNHKVRVQVVEVDGVVTGVNVTESDIASASRLLEVERVTAATLVALNERVTPLEASVADHEARLGQAEADIDDL
jgi:hypothetical protein